MNGIQQNRNRMREEDVEWHPLATAQQDKNRDVSWNCKSGQNVRKNPSTGKVLLQSSELEFSSTVPSILDVQLGGKISASHTEPSTNIDDVRSSANAASVTQRAFAG